MSKLNFEIMHGAKTMKKIVCFAVGCIALSVAGISPSALAGMEVERFPLTGLPVEPGGTQCGLTATFTSGVLQIMVHVRTDRNGGWHATWREQLEGVNLVDENGQTYRMVGNTHIFTPEVTAINENSGGTSTIHDSWNLLVVPTGGGDADMFHLIGRLQIVITPDGEVKTINERIETECI
jgi:hypothetical protein